MVPFVIKVSPPLAAGHTESHPKQSGFLIAGTTAGCAPTSFRFHPSANGGSQARALQAGSATSRQGRDQPPFGLFGISASFLGYAPASSGYRGHQSDRDDRQRHEAAIPATENMLRSEVQRNNQRRRQQRNKKMVDESLVGHNSLSKDAPGSRAREGPICSCGLSHGLAMELIPMVVAAYDKAYVIAIEVNVVEEFVGAEIKSPLFAGVI